MADGLVNVAAATDELMSVTRGRAQIPWHFRFKAGHFEQLWAGQLEFLARAEFYCDCEAPPIAEPRVVLITSITSR